MKIKLSIEIDITDIIKGSDSVDVEGVSVKIPQEDIEIKEVKKQEKKQDFEEVDYEVIDLDELKKDECQPTMTKEELSSLLPKTYMVNGNKKKVVSKYKLQQVISCIYHNFSNEFITTDFPNSLHISRASLSYALKGLVELKFLNIMNCQNESRQIPIVYKITPRVKEYMQYLMEKAKKDVKKDKLYYRGMLADTIEFPSGGKITKKAIHDILQCINTDLNVENFNTSIITLKSQYSRATIANALRVLRDVDLIKKKGSRYYELNIHGKEYCKVMGLDLFKKDSKSGDVKEL